MICLVTAFKSNIKTKTMKNIKSLFKVHLKSFEKHQGRSREQGGRVLIIKTKIMNMKSYRYLV
jgi:hypothetical protein